MEHRKPDGVIPVRKGRTGVVTSSKPKEILNELKNACGVYLGIAKKSRKAGGEIQLAWMPKICSRLHNVFAAKGAKRSNRGLLRQYNNA